MIYKTFQYYIIRKMKRFEERKELWRFTKMLDIFIDNFLNYRNSNYMEILTKPSFRRKFKFKYFLNGQSHMLGSWKAIQKKLITFC